jgi:FtsP/CotA-like multicopper oxidase with cupredoxin domain
MPAGAVPGTACAPPMSMVDVTLDADQAARRMLPCHHLPHHA